MWVLQKYLMVLWACCFWNGIEIDKKKMEAITKWPIPVTVTDVRNFLWFTYYCRWSIPKCDHIARPLNFLTSGKSAFKKNNGKIELGMPAGFWQTEGAEY